MQSLFDWQEAFLIWEKKNRNLLSTRLQRKKKKKKGELKQAAVVESLQHKAGLQPTIENKLCQ